jgi:nicotinate-nucleotide--dimethylbenzimidazole phosphoribosyltransferase
MSLLQQTINNIEPQNQQARQQAQDRLDQLIMPHWALGRMMDMALDLAGMTGSINPPVARRKIVAMAGDHGIAKSGVSLFPQEVTVQMAQGFVAGVAGVSVLARQSGTEVVLVDMGIAGDLDEKTAAAVIDRKIARGTNNFSEGPAMTREQALKAVEAGIEVACDLAESTDVFGTGELGIGNTSPSSAIVATLCNIPVADAVGRGTGLDDEQLQHKIAVIEKGVKLNRPDPQDPIDVLAKVGGFEIAGIAGLILGAALKKKPVIVDGFISTAGALVAAKLCPLACEYMFSAHRSVEKGQVAALAALGKEPLLDLNFRLGEGTGAAVAMNLVEGAVAIMTEMATFAEAAVSKSAE